MAAHLYQPLNVSTWQFRILRLLPGDFDTMVKCELQLHTIIAPPKYIALSYCWGDENDRRMAIVDGTEITITVNLEDALQQLRAFGIELVWVDALCINQHDLQERSLQVRFMKEMYSKAEATYSWLGKNQVDKATLGLQFLQKVSRGAINVSEEVSWKSSPVQRPRRVAVKMSQAHLNNNNNNNHERHHPMVTVDLKSHFEALLDLFERPYWRRRWIIQEVATSKITLIVCGQVVLNLDDVCQAVLRCEESECWTPRHKTLYRFIEQVTCLRKSYHNYQQPGLLQAMLYTRHYHSKDERDKVFALVGLCKDGSELVPTPNYEECVEALNINLTRAILRTNAALDILFLHRHDNTTDDSLPSWCPNWLSESLLATMYLAAQQGTRFPRTYGVSACRGDRQKLFVEGLEFGSVVAMTSILGDRATSTHANVGVQQGTHAAPTRRYYGGAITQAIAACLCASTSAPQKALNIRRRTARLQLLLLSNRGQLPHQTPAWPLWPSLISWLTDNKDFILDGHTLHELTSFSVMSLAPLSVRLYVFMHDDILWHFPIVFLLQITFVFVSCMLVVIPILIILMSLQGSNGIQIVLSDHWWLILLCCIALIFDIFVACPVVYYYVLVSYLRREIKAASEGESLPSARLIILDTGALALACSRTQIGDKVCLVAGCALSVVLRNASVTPEGGLYSVVGRSFVCMSQSDARRYKAFCEPKIWSEESNRDYEQSIEDYKRYEEWRSFVLV